METKKGDNRRMDRTPRVSTSNVGKGMSLDAIQSRENRIIECLDGTRHGSRNSEKLSRMRVRLGNEEIPRMSGGQPSRQSDEERKEIGERARLEAASQLEAQEKVISEHLHENSFYPKGIALRAIRDGNLYRPKYATFEEYLVKRWDIKKTLAYGLIVAADVMDNLKEGGFEILPANEGQARPLGRLKPEEQRKAWRSVLETSRGDRIAARMVKEAAESVRPSSQKSTPSKRTQTIYEAVRRLKEMPEQVEDHFNYWGAPDRPATAKIKRLKTQTVLSHRLPNGYEVHIVVKDPETGPVD